MRESLCLSSAQQNAFVRVWCSLPEVRAGTVSPRCHSVSLLGLQPRTSVVCRCSRLFLTHVGCLFLTHVGCLLLTHVCRLSHWPGCNGPLCSQMRAFLHLYLTRVCLLCLYLTCCQRGPGCVGRHARLWPSSMCRPRCCFCCP